MDTETAWEKDHFFKVNRKIVGYDTSEEIDPEAARSVIEPWLSAIFQSEHFSVLLGSGLTTAVTFMAGIRAQGMGRMEFDGEFKEPIKAQAEKVARESGRGEANLEDDLRVAFELVKGLSVIEASKAEELEKNIYSKMQEFIKNVLKTENLFRVGLIQTDSEASESNREKTERALQYLKSLLISFSSRTASRDRLNIFTTNYDRFIEYACDMSGILLLDRFVGKIAPVLRSTKLELDYHYNPPGIRGEPRYVEGVARLIKMHGSIDWQFQGKQIVREPLRFGAPGFLEETSKLSVIYPNSSKDIDTDFYPYADMFRDFSAALCRPNSALVVYGYSFGDSHINRIIEDMLTLPSTHLVIIAYGDLGKRIENFCKRQNEAQITLLIGSHFGNLENLVDFYLPKAAIDRISVKAHELRERRGDQQISMQAESGEEEGKDDRLI